MQIHFTWSDNVCTERKKKRSLIWGLNVCCFSSCWRIKACNKLFLILQINLILNIIWAIEPLRYLMNDPFWVCNRFETQFSLIIIYSALTFCCTWWSLSDRFWWRYEPQCRAASGPRFLRCSSRSLVTIGEKYSLVAALDCQRLWT